MDYMESLKKKLYSNFVIKTDGFQADLFWYVLLLLQCDKIHGNPRP